MPESPWAALVVLKNVWVKKLLFGNDRIFHAFADAEFERGLGGYLNRLSRSGVTALARFALRKNEFAKTGQNELSIGLNFRLSKSGELVEKLFGLRALHTEFFGEVVNYFGLRHSFLA